MLSMYCCKWRIESILFALVSNTWTQHLALRL